MACKIIYNNREFTQDEFEDYFKANTAQFAHYFLDPEDIKDAVNWVITNKKRPGRTFEELKRDAKIKFEELAAYKRVSEAYNKLAIHSRRFVEAVTRTAKGAVVRRRIDIENLLREDMEEPQLLSSKFYPVGTPLTFEVLDKDNVPMYAGVDNRTETTWGEFKMESGIPADEEYLYVPIAVKNQAGKTIAYIHNANWVDENNIQPRGKSMDEVFEDLANLRRILVENGITHGKISDRKPGAVSLAAPTEDNPRPLIPLTEGFPTAKIAVLGSGRNTGNEKFDNLVTEFLHENKMNLYEGDVIAIHDGPDSVITYTESRKLNDVEIASIMRAIRNFILGVDDFGEEVERTMKLDLSTSNGIAQYLKHFIHLTPIDKQFKGDYEHDSQAYNKAKFNSLLDYQTKTLRIPSENYLVNVSGNSINFVVGGEKGTAFNISTNVKNIKDIERFLAGATNFFALMNLNVNAEHLNKTINLVTLEEGQIKTKKVDYTQYVKEGLSSRVVGYNVGTEEDPEWVYRVNPVINFEIGGSTITEAVSKTTAISPTEMSELGTPVEDDEEALLKQVRKKTKKQREKFGNVDEEGDARPISDEQKRPITADQKRELKGYSKGNILIEGIDPLDLDRVVNNMSAELIQTAFTFEDKSMNGKEIDILFREIRKRLIAKGEEHQALYEKFAAFAKKKPGKYDKDMAALSYLVKAIEALVNNYDQLTKFVIHDIASISGVDLDYVDSEGLKKMPIEELVDKLVKGVGEKVKEEQSAETEEDAENNEPFNGDPAAIDPEEGEGLVFDPEEEDRYQWNTIAKLKKSAKQSISVNLKLFLKSLVKRDVELIDADEVTPTDLNQQIVDILKKKNEGEVETGTYTFTPVEDDAFGFTERYNIDEVIEFLLPQLTNNFFTFEQMLEKMEELSKDDIWLKNIANEVRGANKDLQRDFQRVFNKVVLKMKYLMVSSYLSERDGMIFRMNVVEDNIGETTRVISRTWASKLKSGNKLIYSKDGEFFIKVSKGKEATEAGRPEYEDWGIREWADWGRYWRKRANDENVPHEDQFKYFLSLFGISLHDSIFETIVTGKKIKGKRHPKGFKYEKEGIILTYADQFSSRNGIVKNLTDRLEGLLKDNTGKENVSQRLRKDVSEFYNIGVIQALAKEQAKRSPELRSTSFFSGSSPIASHVDPFYIHKRMFDLKQSGLENVVGFNRANFWAEAFMSNQALLDNHDISLLSLSPLREFDKINFNRDFSKHDELNKEVIKLGMFTSAITRNIEDPNSSTEAIADKMAGYFYPTLGDNSRNLVMMGPRHDFIIKSKNKKIDEDLTSVNALVSEEMVDWVYDYIFLSEARRMAYSRTTPVEPLENGRRIFYSIPALNNIKVLFDENHNFLDDGDPEAVILQENKVTAVRQVIKEFLGREVSEKLEKWQELGIGFRKGETPVFAYIDNKYRQGISENLKAVDEQGNKGRASSNLVIKNVAANFVVNNMLALHSMFGLYIGDPATFYKGAKQFDSVGNPIKASDFAHPEYDFAKDVDSTLQGIFKRLGTEIGPAAQPFADDQELNSEPMSVLVVQDQIAKLTEELRAYYRKVGLTPEEIEEYDNIVKTDGIIFNHPLEHLKSLWRFGKISEQLYKEALEYYDEHGTIPNNVPITTLKTRYLDQQQMSEHQIRVHLKGAEFYLSPELIAGNPVLQKLYDLMGGKTMKINKIAFESTVKTGKIGAFKLFNKDGSISKVKNVQNNILNLTRGGLQLQTSTPNREKERTAKLATQAIKQIFLDVEQYFKEDITKFNQHYSSIVEGKKKDFFREIGYNEQTNKFHVGKFSRKLIDHLRRYTKDLNVFSALQMVDTPQSKIERKRILKALEDPNLTKDQRGILEENLRNLPQRMKSPLFAAPSRMMIEPYAMSLVSSIVDDVQFPGSTYTLTTEAYLATENPNITYTSAYDPEKGLQHYRYEGEEVMRSQVIMSWPFPDLRMEDFLKADGTIDHNKLPKKLFEMIGTRIPVSKQSSIHALEVVGFLPYNYKGVVITSSQFVAQTNWDFDDDKLFFYYPAYTKNTVKEADGTETIKSVSITDKSDINGMLDIMANVLLSPKEEVRKVVHTRVTADLLKPAHDALYSKFTESTNVSFLSEAFYSKTYDNQANVGNMIGIAANLLNLHATIRESGKTPQIKPKNDKVKALIIAGEVSRRKLSEDLDRVGNRISDNITALLQAAVDHANLGWLSVMNVSQHTASALTQAIIEGFSITTAFALINQDIIKKSMAVTEQLKRENEGVAYRLKVIEELLKTYPNPKISEILRNRKLKQNEKMIKITALYDFRDSTSAIGSITKEEYLRGARKNPLGAPEEGEEDVWVSFDKTDEIHWQTYIAFLTLSDMGSLLGSYQTEVNVDSKGYGKMLYMAEQKMDVAVDIAEQELIDDFDVILGKYHKVPLQSSEVRSIEKEITNPADYLSENLPERENYHFLAIRYYNNSPYALFLNPKTVYGIASVNGREALKKTLLNPKHKLYPYGTRSFTTMWSIAENILGSRPAYEKAKIKWYLYNEALAYLNSAHATNLYSDNVYKRRYELNVARREGHSMAQLLDLAKRDPYLKENPFIRKLTAVHEAKGEKSSVEYNGIQRDEISRNSVYSGFYELLFLEGKLIPGTDMTTTEFVEALVENAFINGGIQHSKNYVKIIPADYLEVKGYYNYLYNLDLDDPAIFGFTPNSKQANLPHFLHQFFRHYPEFIKPHKRGVNIVTFKSGETINVTKATVFPLPKEFNVKDPPPFLHFVDEAGNSVLFQYKASNSTYRRLELLKSYPDSQYDANTDNGYNSPVAFKDRFRKDYFSDEGEVSAENKVTDHKGDSFHEGYTKDKTVKEVLENIMMFSTLKSNKDVAEYLLEVYNKNLFDFQFSVKKGIRNKDGAPVSGITLPPKGALPFRILVDPWEATSELDYEQTILHELLHPVVITLATGVKGKVSPKLAENRKALKNIYNIFLTRMQEEYGTTNDEELFKVLPVEVRRDLSNAARNEKEFLVEAMSSNVVREYLNTHIWEGDTSFLKRLYSFIVKLLRSAGFKWKERLGDRVEAILHEQQSLVIHDKLEAIKRYRKEIEESGQYETIWSINPGEVKYQKELYESRYGLGIATAIIEDGDGFSITIDKMKIIDTLIKKVPEFIDEDSLSETVDKFESLSSKKGAVLDDESQISAKNTLKVEKAKSPLELQTLEASLIDEFGPGRVIVDNEKLTVTVLQENYLFAHDIDLSEDYRPASRAATVNNNGQTYSFIEKEAAEDQKVRLEKLYGYGRVSEVVEVDGEYQVEVYDTSDARTVFERWARFPRRSRRKHDYDMSKKAQDKRTIVREYINKKKKQLERILEPLETMQENNPDVATLDKIRSIMDQIDEYEDELATFDDPAVKIEVFDDFVERRLEVLEMLINTDDLLSHEMTEIIQELNWIQGIGDQTIKRDHFLFGNEWLTDSNLRDRYATYAKRAGDLSIEFNDRVLAKLAEEVNRRRIAGEPMVAPADLQQMLHDINGLTADTITMFGVSDHPLVELLGKLINEATLKTSIAAKEDHDKADELIRKFLASSKSLTNPYDIFFEKDKKGKKTNWLIHFFSYEYKKELAAMWGKASSARKRLKVVMPWLKENTNFIDVRVLFPTTEGSFYKYSGKAVTQEDTAKYIKELKEEYGDYIFSRIYKDALNKVKAFEARYELESNLIDRDSDEVVPIEEKVKLMEEFERKYSPYIAAEFLVDGSNKEFVTKFEYVTQPPKRYKEVNGKKVETGWVNEKFFEVTNSQPTLDLYEFFYDKLTLVNTIDKDAVGSLLSHRPINFLKKRFVESLTGSDNKWQAFLGHSYNTFAESIRGLEEPFSLNRETDKDGNTIYRAVKHVTNDQSMINEKATASEVTLLAELQKTTNEAEFRAVLDKWGIESKELLKKYNHPKRLKRLVVSDTLALANIIKDRKGYPEIWRGLRETATREYFEEASMDLGTVVKYYTNLANTYKNAYTAESLINLVSSVLNESKVVSVDAFGNEIRNDDGSFREKNFVESNLKDVIDYQLHVTMGGARYNKGDALKEKVYTTQEKAKKAELEALRDDPNVDPEVKALLQVQIDELGSPAYYNKIADGMLKYTALIGLGWRLLSGHANFLIGQATNFIESSARRHFSDQALVRASNMLKWSVVKNFTFNQVEKGEAKKIRSIMDRYSFLSDMTTEFYKSSSLSPVSSWFRWLAPKQITSRVEYINQAQIVLAYLLDHKVSEFMPEYKGTESLYEALDEEGKWRSKEFGEIPIETLANITGAIEQIKERVIGAYNFNRTIKGKRVLGGRMLGMYHTWIPEFVRARLGHERKDPFSRVIYKGRWRTAAQLVTGQLETHGLDTQSILDNIIFVMRNMFRQMAYNERFTDYDADNLRMFLREVAMLISLFTIRLIAKGLGDLDDDKKENNTNNFLVYYLVNTSSRLMADLTFVQSMLVSRNPQSGAIPAIGLTENLYKFFISAGSLIGGDEDGLDGLGKSLGGFVPAFSELGRIEKYLTSENPYTLEALKGGK